jgi:asparagine synthase (glutamine-hydrolysing)
VNKLKTLWYLNRYFGPGWLAYRLDYALRARTGMLVRQMPARSWEDQPLAGFLMDARLADPQDYLAYRRAGAPDFTFDFTHRPEYQPHLTRWDREGAPAIQEADGLAQGQFFYFHHSEAQAGFPPDWHRNPFTGQSLPASRHWSLIGDFEDGDIKVIWDLNRFGFTYALVRAYWRTGDENYSERFWQLVEDWHAHNPPQLGPNWKCGQEASFRLMAWCFGLYGFEDSPASTAERVCMLGQMAAVTGYRIEANLQHALSQHNNHGISEGLGLWTAGLLFPELKHAGRWREKGREVLERLGQELIYENGAFAQHSANYQRLALHDYLWALRLGEVNRQPLSPELVELVKRAGELVYQLQDETSGRLPNYGHNDGSLILPLSNCDYADYRPVVQAISYLTTGERRYEGGPWDEDLLWLFGPQALQAPVNTPARVDFKASQGGLYTLRSKSGFAFIHSPVYRHRPAHAGPGNIDIWWRGQNMVLDAGTYSYNAPPPWDHPLAGAAFHNAVTVDGLEPMERVGRFLWLPWVKGTVLRGGTDPGDDEYNWIGEHDGYQRLHPPLNVWRGLRKLGEERWLVHDRLRSEGEHVYRLQWLLPDYPYTWDEAIGQLEMETPAGKYYVRLQADGKPEYSLVRADRGSARGWQSLYYYARQPAFSLECVVWGELADFITLFGPDPAQFTKVN